MVPRKRTQVILAVILLLSLLGASSVSARTASNQEANQQSAIPIDSYQAISLGPTNGVRHCFPDWTGHWLQTYLRVGYDHWVTKCVLYVPDFINNEKDAQAWRYSDEYLAEKCSLENEEPTWQGIYLHTEKETVRRCYPIQYGFTLRIFEELAYQGPCLMGAD